MQTQHFEQKVSNDSTTNTSENTNDSSLFFIEELSDELLKRFNQQHLTPYFKSVFADLLLRSSAISTKERVSAIDKVTLIEFISLPGILSDRFYSLLGSADKSSSVVILERFLSTMIQVFSSTLDEKMQLVFKMFDFDSDGKISAQDVRLILSYIPIRSDSNSSLSLSDSSLDYEDMTTTRRVKPLPSQEGLYNRSEGRNMNDEERGQNQRLINNFVSSIFKGRQSFNFKEFVEFNTSVSSEMFISVISVLHERLPCSQYVFRQKKIFKHQEFIKNQKLLIGKKSSSTNSKCEDQDSIVAKAEEMCLSPMRALASPKIMQVWQPKNQKSLFQPDQQQQPARCQSSSSKKSSQATDFKIRKKVGADSTRQQALMNSRFSNYSSDLADSDIEPERHESIVRLIEDSKMRRLQDAKRNWSRHHGANSPFRFSDLGSKERSNGEHSSSQNQITLQNCKESIDQSLFKQKSTFSKLKNDFADRISNIMSPQSSNFKRGPQPRLQVQTGKSIMGGSSPVILPNKNNFETSQLLVEPGSPLITKSLTNQDYFRETVIENFSNDSGIQQSKQSLEGKCFLKTRTDRFKEHWAVVVGKDLLCFRNQIDTEHRVMHCLTGTFISESPSETNPDTGLLLYPVKVLLPPNKSRILYFSSNEMQQRWINLMKKIVGESDVKLYYDLQNNLGKGQFGVVKLATHKKNGKQVAIKTIVKANMKPIEIFQQRKEIEVLKMCQHVNIIKLIDLFESCENYFIVLEYMAGKDLFDYIAKRSYILPEERAKHIIFQIIQGVKYLHNLGIVHRDLKLENIMMSNMTDNAIPKIVDFGLSKIIGPNETATEPFGTLGYVAPEVLKKQPYSYSCDVWSLGCILYALLSGSLPFDHSDQKELIKMTMDENLKFDLPVWSRVSTSCKCLITEMLKKNQAQRITLDSAMADPWFDTVRRKLSSEQLLV